MKKMNLFYRTVVLLVFAIAITVMGVGCCCVDPYDDDDSDRYSAETDSYQDIMLTAQTGFSLESVNGSIEIQASSSDSVIQVWAEKKVKADSQWEADRYLDQLELKDVITELAGKLADECCRDLASGNRYRGASWS